MGNICCADTASEEFVNGKLNYTTVPLTSKTANDSGLDGGDGVELPHISEREDLSNHRGTLFLEHSLKRETTRQDRTRRHTMYSPPQHISKQPTPTIQKSNSCSTIFIDDNTASQPNLKLMLKCVSLAIYYHIRNRDDESQLMEIFDEKLHPLSKDPVPENYARLNPEHKHIYRFVKTLFSAAQLTAECSIITLVYLERLITYAEVSIAASNWKRIVLGAILLASKVWDDEAVWNVDYCQILRDIQVEDMNELERVFLELLQYNINVPASVYAKYYFDLRALAERNHFNTHMLPLDIRRARKLEAISRLCEDNNEKLERTVRRLNRSNSMDDLKSKRRSIAVIS
jgi:hypothetical protein